MSIEFTLPSDLEAHDPPESRGTPRDGVRMMVSQGTTGDISHHRFGELPGLLRPGDLIVVNTSGTLPAEVVAVPAERHLAVHFSTAWPDGGWLVELRSITGPATVPDPGGAPGDTIALPGGARLILDDRVTGRLWRARLSAAVVPSLLRHGVPIRYSYVQQEWPLDAYQTVFATRPGSAEMPSASRPFSPEVVTRLGARAGPPVVRALGPAAGAEPAGDGLVAAAAGWTSHIVTPEVPLLAVDGLLTGLHEPRSSHLRMLAAFAGPELLGRCYQAAIDQRYLWHEFGDVHLLLP